MITGLTNDFTAFCDGRCETIQTVQTEVGRLEDKIRNLEEKFPKCTFTWRKFMMNMNQGEDGNCSHAQQMKKSRNSSDY